MGRKKRKTAELKPFCYYCDRQFDDEKVLLLHQKARHFKCNRCNRKLDTATGLVVHLLQVHKESLDRVPNSKKDRESPEIVVHGMSGVPPTLIAEKQAKLSAEVNTTKANKGNHTIFGSDMFGPSNGLTSLTNMLEDTRFFGNTAFSGFQFPAAVVQNNPAANFISNAASSFPANLSSAFGHDFVNSPFAMLFPHLAAAARIAPSPANATVVGVGNPLLPPTMMPGNHQQTQAGMTTDRLGGIPFSMQFSNGGGNTTNNHRPSGFDCKPPPPPNSLNIPQPEKVPAIRPANGVLVYDDDKVSMEERRAYLTRYNYRIPSLMAVDAAAC